MTTRIAIVFALVAVASCGSPASDAPPPVDNTLKATTVSPYQSEIEKFRHDREAKLTSDTGWLTIAGLSFLTKPETTFGSDASSDVVLPAGAPAKAGAFVLADQSAAFLHERGVPRAV